MLEIATELAMTDADYADMALKFCEHFLWIASAMTHLGEDTGMWDEEDGFFYDVLRLPNGQAQRLKVRSMVGLLPLCAATVFEGELLAKQPELAERLARVPRRTSRLYAAIHDPRKVGVAGRRLGSILDETKLRRVLAKMLDENEFLSPYGLRSLSRFHAEHPYVIQAGGQEYRVSYLPAESDTGMFGGNSNWRGPIWMPVNALIIRALLQYYTYDKRLYDRLREGHARPVREHLFAGLDYQNKLARFLENHDEPRAAAAFSPGIHEAAAVITFLAPGLRFFHQGQFEGRRNASRRISVAARANPPTRNCSSSTSGCSLCSASPRCGMASGSCSNACPPGRATGPGIASWPSPGWVPMASDCWWR